MTARNPKKAWTVLAYLAGDNDLASAAVEDINEMEVVGSTDRVHIVAQIDHAADYSGGEDDFRSTRRYYITKDADRRRITSRLLADLGPTNTGDAAVIEDFLRSSLEAYPAERTMLVLWNHGTGFVVPEEIRAREAVSRGELDGLAIPKLRRSFFSASRSRILGSPREVRGILYDDGSADCLDNQELQRVLAFANERLGHRKLDVLGMDACLMTMVEVAYQVHAYASVLVGSEEVEPASGWPYDTILADLAAKPEMDAVELGETIVRRFVGSFTGASDPESRARGGSGAAGVIAGEGRNVTQAAIDLSKLGDLVASIDELARALLTAMEDLREVGAVTTARKRATRFYDSLYVDLHDFATQLAGLTSSAAVRAACDGVARTIEGRGATTPILAEGHSGPRMGRVRGLSIYLPRVHDPSMFYEELDFAKATRWADFLAAYARE